VSWQRQHTPTPRTCQRPPLVVSFVAQLIVVSVEVEGLGNVRLHPI
jgi:hypothetical protein